MQSTHNPYFFSFWGARGHVRADLMNDSCMHLICVVGHIQAEPLTALHPASCPAPLLQLGTPPTHAGYAPAAIDPSAERNAPRVQHIKESTHVRASLNETVAARCTPTVWSNPRFFGHQVVICNLIASRFLPILDLSGKVFTFFKPHCCVLR
jgi:hypothetical protein